ncbi:MAG: isoleucine--tRNA ligase [Candidatus Margulisiibacteriota bacterium]
MSDQTPSTPSFKDTVNLPQTDFNIRANLSEKEPELFSFWDQIQLSQKMADKPSQTTYTLHDGPPYPNGNIHMGHALNKILKDVIVRSKTMAGAKSVYIPGWDCHGLPIETQVIKALKSKGEEHKKADIAWFRERCKDFALDYVATQKDEFKRLGVLGEWEKPYLTLQPGYETEVIRLFGQMADNGLVYKSRKPIHWCMHCETALAEAEIEYADHRSPSIFVLFSVKEAGALKPQAKPLSILVWTTTPWTLPSNVAIAAHPDFSYALVETQDRVVLMAEALVEKVLTGLGWEGKIFQTLTGAQLQGLVAQHPFIDRESPLVLADYVTQEDGTGFVHIAPGHGQDDAAVGRKYNLPTVMPVNDQGKFTAEVPFLEGQFVFDANKTIGQLLEEKGHLAKLAFIKHSYPHCWRCKNPVIFRATEQWFIAMDKPMPSGKTLRQAALDAIATTEWIPAWGENRIQSMIENRPDWCISRQRYWGIPVPIFTCQDCGHSEMTGAFNQAVIDHVAKDGTMAWFSKSAEELLPKTAVCSGCGGNHFKKEADILDVWFESGASFGAVLKARAGEGVTFPADLYLEGSDQHRGWFQSSLLIGLGAAGLAPYQSVLTHGFLVDDKGKKMSKSLGNVIAPQSVIKEYGADVLRWWIASADFKDDISISKPILNQSRDSFSKVRNTIRFCLSNLFDFNAQTDALPYAELSSIDQWALAELNALIQKTRTAYEMFQLHGVTHGLHEFCAVTLSALYLDMVKDRLYCAPKSGKVRRSTQTVLWQMADTLIRLLAPVLVFTAEDAYQHFDKPNKCDSVHLEALPNPNPTWENPDLSAKWTQLLSLKDAVYKDLEALRNEKTIKSFMEAEVCLNPKNLPDFDDFESLFIVSQVKQDSGLTLPFKVKKAEGSKCERCWRVLPISDVLCERCKEALAHA